MGKHGRVPRLVEPGGMEDLESMLAGYARPQEVAEAFGITLRMAYIWGKDYREERLKEQVDEYLWRTANEVVRSGSLLLAKTCDQCDLLLGEQWFTLEREKYWRGTCRLCRSKKSKQNRENRGHSGTQDQNRRVSLGAKQKHTKEHATNHHKPWTQEDLKVLSVSGVSPHAKAIQLGRTHKAVEQAIYRMREGQRQGLPDDLSSEQWVIYFKGAS